MNQPFHPACHRTARFLPILLVLASAVLGARAFAAAPTLRGFAPCAWGSAQCSPCVQDAVDSIARLRDHGDVLGYHMNGAPDVDSGHHWQGVQRLMNSDGRFIVISRSIPDPSVNVAFVVVHMGSREVGGLRFRSNRLDPDTFFEFTPPPAADGIVSTFPMPAGFDHAGGVQLSGNFLAVPYENGGSKVVIYNLADPLNPVALPAEVDHSNFAAEAGTASLSKLEDGRFLLIIGRADANILDFYVSSTADLTTSTFSHFDTWSESELRTDIGDSEFGNYQNLNLLPQCDGTMFLVGTHENSAIMVGEDFVDLYRMDNGTGDDVVITKVAKKHLFCDYRGTNHCNLDAAGGIYVDPAGRLYVYGTEHDNDGPSGSVKFEEFRPVPHSACDHIRDAWVELYDDNSFGDRGLMIDFKDRDLEDYTNYDRAEAFEDKASSVRWCIPPGATHRLWEDKDPCGGDHVDLVGTGSLEAHGNLDSLSFGDDTSCSGWIGGPFADAGPDRAAECASPAGTPIQLDGGASVALSGSLSFDWEAPGVTFDDPQSANPTGSFPLGSTVATLTVSDGTATDEDTANVVIRDTTRPSITCPPPVTIECSQTGGTPVTDPLVTAFLDGATATDACDGDPAIVHDAPPVLGLGETIVTFTATDDSGNSTSCTSSITVADTTPPLLDPAFSILPAILQPPNHKLRTMRVPQIVARDVCDPEPVIFCSVESDEPPDARTGDGRTRFDIVFDGEPVLSQGTGERVLASTNGIGSFDLQLRAERDGTGDGRTYTTSCSSVDASRNRGNPALSLTEVPHDKRREKPKK